ncbi:threonylcarbamoyl-AMP synthase [Candidatus Saccharibacteria bacterium]|nr:threonylcarbamoyl-AMP synthase [Candidatus Saccharibacteria bacterium]
MHHTFQHLGDKQLIALLKSGSVGVLPTDTIYGLVCSAQSKKSVARLFTIKQREANPGTVLAGSLQQLIDLGIRGRYLKAVEYFWPNPLSVVIPCGEDLAYLHMGKHSLAVRIPDDTELRALLKEIGPLMTTSANHPGQPTARNFQEAFNYFGDAVDFYVDTGDMGERPPSTIIRVVDDAIEVLRQGAVNIDDAGRITHE